MGWFAVFAKAPQAGFVKTRLCPPLDTGAAAELYRAMLWDTVEESARSVKGTSWRLVLAVHPPDASGSLARAAPAGTKVVAQRGADLGARMSHLARSAAAAGVSALVLRGSDSPTMSRALITTALQSPAEVDVALSPDPDGGYNLAALSARALRRGFAAPHDLFAHPMSTGAVLEETRARARRADLVVRILAESFDVDRSHDLRRLSLLRGEAALRCPRTLACMEELGLRGSAALPA